jgi:hypothetical protein
MRGHEHRVMWRPVGECQEVKQQQQQLHRLFKRAAPGFHPVKHMLDSPIPGQQQDRRTARGAVRAACPVANAQPASSTPHLVHVHPAQWYLSGASEAQL